MYNKTQIEDALKDLLDDCLSSNNQEGSIKSLTYDGATKTCSVTLSVHIMEEDEYIGFQGY